MGLTDLWFWVFRTLRVGLTPDRESSPRQEFYAALRNVLYELILFWGRGGIQVQGSHSKVLIPRLLL